MDVIKSADYVVELGPDGGQKGGQIVAVGTPEEVSKNPASYTGNYLREELR
jgi:excinuclease ABC subunit A